MVPNGSSIEKDARFQNQPIHILQSPRKEAPPPGSDRRALIERDAPFPRLETYFSNDLFRISWSLKLSLLPIRLYTFLLSGV